MAANILLELHAVLLRTMCEHSGRSFHGLAIVGRILRLECGLTQRLARLDAATEYIRHISGDGTKGYCDDRLGKEGYGNGSDTVPGDMSFGRGGFGEGFGEAKFGGDGDDGFGKEGSHDEEDHGKGYGTVSAGSREGSGEEGFDKESFGKECYCWEAAAQGSSEGFGKVCYCAEGCDEAHAHKHLDSDAGLNSEGTEKPGIGGDFKIVTEDRWETDVGSITFGMDMESINANARLLNTDVMTATEGSLGTDVGPNIYGIDTESVAE